MGVPTPTLVALNVDGTLLWAVGASVLALTAVIALGILMHSLRARLDPERTPEQIHLFDQPVTSGGPMHRMETRCWCRPEVQFRDGGTYVLHHVHDEGDH